MSESFLGIGLKADFVSHDVIITGLDIIRIKKCRSGRMKISIISLNMGSIDDLPKISIPAKLAVNPDIYVEFTQEDGREPIEIESDIGSNTNNTNYGTFSGGARTMSLVDTDKLLNMIQVAHISLNATKSEQNIITNIFVKKSLNLLNVETGIRSAKPRKGSFGNLLELAQNAIDSHSKGYVWAKLTFDKCSVLFVNMHLPVDTSNARTLGYEYRKNKFFKFLTELQEKLDDRTSIVVGGDLNFRREIELTKNENSVQFNQLTRLVESEMPIPLKELPFTDGRPKYTCKFKTVKSFTKKKQRPMDPLEYKRCRGEGAVIQSVGVVTEPISTDCLDLKRIPSRCDRFLVGGAGASTLTVSEHDSAMLVPESDHNAIYATFRIGPQLGGRRRTRRAH
jgi:hypothetical protein